MYLRQIAVSAVWGVIGAIVITVMPILSEVWEAFKIFKDNSRVSDAANISSQSMSCKEHSEPGREISNSGMHNLNKTVDQREGSTTPLNASETNVVVEDCSQHLSGSSPVFPWTVKDLDTGINQHFEKF